MFASAFLIPALGVVLLITGGVGLFGLVVYAVYRVASYIVGVVWGPGQRRELQRTVGQFVEDGGRA